MNKMHVTRRAGHEQEERERGGLNGLDARLIFQQKLI